MLNFDLSHEQQLIYSYGDSLAREFDRKYWMACAEKKAFPAEMYRKIAADGFLGLMVSERYGGSGLGMLEAALFSEGMSNNGIPMLSLIVGATMSMSPIDKFGTEAQKQRFLPDCCQGKIRFCFAITEPNAGTNTMAATTFAREQGGKFFLSGQKVFITDAGDSDYALVVTRTTPLAEARKKTDGFTLFIVDMKAPGISLQYIPVSVQVPEKQWLVFFDNVELSLDDVLGEVGRGFELLFDSLNPERILVAAMAVGLGRFALGKAVTYANERRLFNNVPIGAYQGLQHPLAIAKAEIEMAALMTHKAAWAYDQGVPAGEFSNMAKYYAAEAACHAVDAAIQCFGGNGFTKEYGIFDLYPLVRLFRTGPINREMLLNYVAEHVMGMPRSY